MYLASLISHPASFSRVDLWRMDNCGCLCEDPELVVMTVSSAAAGHASRILYIYYECRPIYIIHMYITESSLVDLLVANKWGYLSCYYSLFQLFSFFPRYEFNDSDLRCACDTIDTWIDDAAKGRSNLPPDRVPWSALRTLFSQAVYGGRIDNDFDQRLLNTFLERIFTPMR